MVIDLLVRNESPETLYRQRQSRLLYVCISGLRHDDFVQLHNGVCTATLFNSGVFSKKSLKNNCFCTSKFTFSLLLLGTWSSNSLLSTSGTFLKKGWFFGFFILNQTGWKFQSTYPYRVMCGFFKWPMYQGVMGYVRRFFIFPYYNLTKVFTNILVIALCFTFNRFP